MAPRRPRPDHVRAIGYVRVSTDEQVAEGASLEAQRAALTAETQRRGWDLQVVADEGVSAKNLNRPALRAALRDLDAGNAEALMAVRLDRVSRSVADFAGLLERAYKKGWQIVLLSPDLDTADAAGRFTAHVIAAAAEYERALISQRTGEGMAQRRAEGIHTGRSRSLPIEVVVDIVEQRRAGRSLRQIADDLTSRRVPTAHGAPRWSAATVRRVLTSHTAIEITERRNPE